MYLTESGKVASHAVKRGQFSYSSQIFYRTGLRYELFFLNPLRQALTISVFEAALNGDTAVETLQIPPFGHRRFAYDGQGMQLGWNSPIPICRPIIFEHYDTLGTFDVFHG